MESCQDKTLSKTDREKVDRLLKEKGGFKKFVEQSEKNGTAIMLHFAIR